jgi:hypothetical protein
MQPKNLIAAFMFSAVILSSCDFPYAPQIEPTPFTEATVDTTSTGRLYPINKTKQICNPSISQDMVNYPACMLWLGFSGELVVNVPSPMSGFSTTNVKQHDRLTVVDTANTVRWYIMRDELGVSAELQDPEWSTHPNYVTCLGKAANAEDWDGFFIRMSDKASLKFCKDSLCENSTPHLWVPDSAQGGGIASAPTYDPANGMVTKQSIQEFFGTTTVKAVYSLRRNGLSLYYIDYSESVPHPVTLIKPTGKESKDCESPLISPDGNWVTYNCAEDVFTYHAYMQRLQPGSTPILIADKASDPHWWVDPNQPTQMFIIYTQLTGSYVVQQDLAQKDIAAGATLKQRLIGSSKNVPAHMGLRVDQSSTPEVISSLPFRGGLSRDGSFLATGYLFGYILQLP